MNIPLELEQPSIIDAGVGSPHNEIKEKVDFWRLRMQSQLSRFNTQADFWRLIKPPRAGDLTGFANPQSTETTRAAEAIATFIYRALTSAQPNFQFTSTNPNVSQADLWTREQVVSWQQDVTNYRRKLMKACRSVAVFGTVPIEQPWIQNMPYYESTDFQPLSLLQLAFDPLAYDMALSGWHAVIWYVTADMLRDMVRKSPGVWDEQAIKDCISMSAESKNLSPELLARLSASGYLSQSSAGKGTSSLYQLVLYYGPLSDDDTGTEWCIATLNDIKTIRGHKSVYKRRPLGFSHLNEFELEPYGYGVGRIAESLQPEINSNRARMHDTITFSLFNMWLANRNSGIKSSQMKIKPWALIDVDGDPETALKALRPQLEGVNFGVILEKLMKEEFRSTTGASDSLQAMVTEATATEASIAQNEAVRRVSVIAEMQGEALLREHISKMDENNMTFLDQPFSIAVTGEPKPVRIYPSSFASEVEVHTKIVTDKDFRPQRNKDLLAFLQTVTSIRSEHPQLPQINIEPIVEEFARSMNINPKKVWSAIPKVPGIMNPMAGSGPQVPDAMGRLDQLAGRAQDTQSLAQGDGLEALLG